MERIRLAPLALALAALTLPAQAQQATSDGGTALRDVVVTGTRTEAEAHKVPATVTRITREEIDRRVPADEAELFEDEPDVSFARDARRFGATRPNIRGIEDNRVLQLVDGIRLPNFYNGGGPTNFTMNAPLGPSLDFMKRVEILRGPASSLYGSDAIGGVVGYLTLDPGDLLGRDEKFGARARLGYNGANEGATASALAAGRNESLEWVLGVTRTDANEFDNKGTVGTTSPTRTEPNPLDVRDQGVFAKFLFRPADGHKVGLTLEGREQDATIDVLRLSTSLPKVTAMSGDDHVQRLRGSVDWEHKPQGGWYDRLFARVYQQTNETLNFNVQTRTNTSATCSAAAGTRNNCSVAQEFTFDQTLTGGSAQVERALGDAHLLTLGVDLSRLSTEERRDALVRNLTTGTVSKSLAGDTFPLRDFAPGYTDSAGLFVQDEIFGLAGGKLTLTPGLRYDLRTLQPEVDALSQNVLTATGNQAVTQTDSAFSPKLAALWQFTPVLAGYGQIVRGFRAPNYEEVNGHFRNTAQSYGISPNPGLEPETSTGVEAGLRLNRSGLRGQIAVYDNHYQDFISSVRLVCPADPNCIAGLTTTFMSVNLSRVRIYGAEARLGWEFAPGWRVDGALAHARGTDESSGQPLDTIEPTRLSIGLVRDAGTWGAEARLRAAASVKRVNDMADAATYSPWFRPPSYEVLDLGAWWRPNRQIRLSVVANNLFDQKYWLWSDIRIADARNPAGVDFYSQPGRNVAARLEYSF